MDVFTMVAIIVIATTLGGAYNTHMKAKRKQHNDEDTVALEAEIDVLRERIEVLEKIVTDEKYQLAREFDQLERSSAQSG